MIIPKTPFRTLRHRPSPWRADEVVCSISRQKLPVNQTLDFVAKSLCTTTSRGIESGFSTIRAENRCNRVFSLHPTSVSCIIHPTCVCHLRAVLSQTSDFRCGQSMQGLQFPHGSGISCICGAGRSLPRQVFRAFAAYAYHGSARSRTFIACLPGSFQAGGPCRSRGSPSAA